MRNKHCLSFLVYDSFQMHLRCSVANLEISIVARSGANFLGQKFCWCYIFRFLQLCLQALQISLLPLKYEDKIFDFRRYLQSLQVQYLMESDHQNEPTLC